MRRLETKRGSTAFYLVLLIAVILTMLGLKECTSKALPPKADDTASGDTINVAIEISPIGITTTGDTLGGYYYNMLRQLAQSNNRPIKFHAFTRLPDALDGLNKARYQLVAGDIPITAELKESFIFVDPLGTDRQVLVQRRDSVSQCLPITTQTDLGGKTICIPKGSPFKSRIQNLSHEIGDTIYILEDPDYSTEQIIILTALGQIDATVANAASTKPFLERYPQLDASVAISMTQLQGWLLAPSDTTLRNTLNSWLAK